MFVKTIGLLFIFIFVPLASATMSINIAQNNPSLNLNHGQPISQTFTISNSNSWCPILCTYTLSGDNGQIFSQDQKTASAGVPFSLSWTFTAPTKQIAKQDSGTIQYLLKIDCNVVTSLTCWSDSASQTSTVTLNYDLAQDEKNAKSYLQNLLPSIGDSLKNSESTIYTLNSKLSALPKNVLVSDLKDQLTNYNSYYTNYKNNYDSTNKLYSLFVNTGDYIGAKNNLDPNIQSLLTQLTNNLNSLSSSIETRIKIHN